APQGESAEARSAASETFCMAVVRAASGHPAVAAPGDGAAAIKGCLLVLIEEEGGAGLTGLRDERHHAIVGNRGDDDGLGISRPRNTDRARRNARSGLLSPRSRSSGVQFPQLSGAEHQAITA